MKAESLQPSSQAFWSENKNVWLCFGLFNAFTFPLLQAPTVTWPQCCFKGLLPDLIDPQLL